LVGWLGAGDEVVVVACGRGGGGVGVGGGGFKGVGQKDLRS